MPRSGCSALHGVNPNLKKLVLHHIDALMSDSPQYATALQN